MKTTANSISYALRVVIFLLSFSCLVSAQLIRDSENMKPSGKGFGMQDDVNGAGSTRAAVSQRGRHG